MEAYEKTHYDNTPLFSEPEAKQALEWIAYWTGTIGISFQDLNKFTKPTFHWGETIEQNIADQQRKRQIELNHIDEQNQEQVKKAAKIEREQRERELKNYLNNLSLQSGWDVDMKLQIAQKYNENLSQYKKAEETGNMSDYIVARSFDPISGQPLAKQDIPKYPAWFTEYLPNGSQKNHDGNGNYSVWVKLKDGVMVFSQLTPTGQAPIWSPTKTETPPKEQPKTEQPTQLPANVYKTGSGYIKDTTPIPQVLQWGKIQPHQYFTQNGINMSDRANLAVKMWILKDASEWQGTAWQNYALVDALEKQKQWVTTGQPTTQPTEQAWKPWDWIADKARPIYHVEWELKKETPFDITVPERFTDTDTRKMLEKLSPEERNKKIWELDLLNVKAWLENAINNADISTINQLLWTTYHQGNERERMDELPMILANARMKLNTLTAEDATSYMNRNNSQMYGAQKTFAGDTSPRFAPWRQQVLLDIARGSTKYQTEISPEEQQFINQVKASDQKNVYKENFNQFRNQYDTLLKSWDIEWAKNLWKQYKGTIASMKQISPEYAAYAPELEKQVEEQIKVVPWLEKPKPKKNIQTKPHPQPAPLWFTEKDLNEQQVQNLKDMKVQWKSLDEMRSKAIQYNESNKKSQVRPASFSEVNNGTAPTLPNRIEASNISPDNPQALGLEKNPIRRN